MFFAGRGLGEEPDTLLLCGDDKVFPGMPLLLSGIVLALAPGILWPLDRTLRAVNEYLSRFGERLEKFLDAPDLAFRQDEFLAERCFEDPAQAQLPPAAIGTVCPEHESGYVIRRVALVIQEDEKELLGGGFQESLPAALRRLQELREDVGNPWMVQPLESRIVWYAVWHRCGADSWVITLPAYRQHIFLFTENARVCGQ